MGQYHDVTPSKSAEILVVLYRCQLPYEMLYCLHECLQAATEELSRHYKKPCTKFDAQDLQPYLV